MGQNRPHAGKEEEGAKGEEESRGSEVSGTDAQKGGSAEDLKLRIPGGSGNPPFPLRSPQQTCSSSSDSHSSCPQSALHVRPLLFTDLHVSSDPEASVSP